MKRAMAALLGASLGLAACGRAPTTGESETTALVEPNTMRALVIEGDKIAARKCENPPSPASCVADGGERDASEIEGLVATDYDRQASVLKTEEALLRQQLVESDEKVKVAIAGREQAFVAVKQQTEQLARLAEAKKTAETTAAKLDSNLAEIYRGLATNPNQPLLLAERDRVEAEVATERSRITELATQIEAGKKDLEALKAAATSADQALHATRQEAAERVSSPQLDQIRARQNALTQAKATVAETFKALRETANAYIELDASSPLLKGMELIFRALDQAQWHELSGELKSDLYTWGLYAGTNTRCCVGCSCSSRSDSTASLKLVSGFDPNQTERPDLAGYAAGYRQVCEAQEAWFRRLMYDMYPSTSKCHGAEHRPICYSYNLYYGADDVEKTRAEACRRSALMRSFVRLPWRPTIFQ